MRIVLLASGAFALPTLRWLGESDCEVPLVVTQPARPSGRGRRVARTPVAMLADELGMRVVEVDNVNERVVVDRIHSTGAHLGLVIAFGQKLGADLLGCLSGGWANLHASLLPKYRGAAPVNWAILRGEMQTGCTVFRMIDRMDAGPILVTRTTTIKPEETAGELHDRLAQIGVEAVRETVTLFDGGAIPGGTPQSEGGATPAPKLKKSDGVFGFDQPALGVVRHICGMTPWPGAATRFRAASSRSERVVVTRARRVEEPSTPTIPPGTIDHRRYVAAQDGYVELLEIRPASSRTMTWLEYVNGRHVKTGDTFVTPDR